MNLRLKMISASCLTFCSTILSAQVPSTTINYRSISSTGNGCPNNSARAKFSDDNGTLTLSFDSFKVRSGANISNSESKKSCTVILDVSAPRGWIYSLTSATFSGNGNLTENSQANLTSIYTFSRDFPFESFTNEMTDSFFGPFREIANSISGGLRWSYCENEKTLKIKSEIFLPIDVLDANEIVLKQNVYKINWKRCVPTTI